MPLISQQHVVSVFGNGTDAALEELASHLDELPVVKVVSMSAWSEPMPFLTSTIQIVKIVAVVEEA